MTRVSANPDAAASRPPTVRRGDAIDHWLGMFTRFLRLPVEQTRGIRDELDSHIRERVRDLMLAGLSEDEGVRRAIDELGEAAELAAHFHAAHRPNRRFTMGIAAIGVAAGAAVISIVALTQTPQPAPQAPAVTAHAEPHEPGRGVPVLREIPIISSLFTMQPAETRPPAKINFKADRPTVRQLAQQLAQASGLRLLLTAGD
ncbi:MAG TPA: permease prefix domain 1-containing protein, partial [Phycisphaerales bacterium]|nr:permease prefix domain 1-containing protein [Phycisphaerales bacterium]